MPTPTPTPTPSSPGLPKSLAQLTPEERSLELQTFKIAFEALLENMANAMTFEAFCNLYIDPMNRRLSPARFRTWIFLDPERKKSYYGAKVMAAEAMEDEMIRIADGLARDGTPLPADPHRTRQMIDVRWKLLPIYNRDRYNPVTQIEQTTTVSMQNIDSVPTEDLKQLVLRKLAQSNALPARYAHLMAKLQTHSMDGQDPGDLDTPDTDDPLDPDPDPDGPTPIDLP